MVNKCCNFIQFKYCDYYNKKKINKIKECNGLLSETELVGLPTSLDTFMKIFMYYDVPIKRFLTMPSM